MKLIPQPALDCFPLSDEAFSQWNDKTDLLQFLYELHDFPVTMLAQDGTTVTSSARHVGIMFYGWGKESIPPLIKMFSDKAAESVPVPAAVTQVINIPDFVEDPVFGRAAKHYIVWERMVGRALEDSLYFSKAHILESSDDIKCSFNLAAQFYYKQALQVLRGFLENLVLPIHFCESPQEFLNWKANNYRTPSLRGKNGILKALVDKGVISNQLANEVSSVYDDLNGCIHGSEKRLINKDVYSGGYMGHVFKSDDFYEWCNYLCRSVDAGVQLLAINLDQWQSIRSAHKLLCSVCHNTSDFEKQESWFGGQKFYVCKCSQCGREMTVGTELIEENNSPVQRT